MTSLEFFNHEKISNRPAVDWGTGELQSEKFDPTYIKAPTYLLKNQPIDQVYRESNLELSNVRLNDQLMPGVFKINMNDKQIQQPFPMQHPYTSHMSYNAVFPTYTAPEDAKRGEVMLKCNSMIYDVQTPSKVDDSVILKKTKGFPWRQELQQLQLPTQRKGIWYEDKQYYHVPKPEDQTFYAHPQNIHVSNPRLRPEERSIDIVTANVLRNKEKQLMQSTHQADYYKDGLGTQAPVNSDDLVEKKNKYESTGLVNEKMNPFFKRGGGITHGTLVPNDLSSKSVSFQDQPPTDGDESKKNLLTKFEFDEKLMETGKDYVNLPDSYNTNNPLVKMEKVTFGRSNTMPDLSKIAHSDANRVKSACAPKNKLDAEKQKIDLEHHERVQQMQLENRKRDIELITPDRDIRLLRIKSDQLETLGPAKGAKPNLKQSVKQHIQTFYNQEAKYFGERAQLYRTPVYNPYLVNQYIETVKCDPKITANYTSGSANPTQANVTIPNDSYEHRPKLFAHKVFSDYELLKRGPLEQVLTDPTISSSNTVQENGVTHQQTTYGGSYNCKKFLQEHDANVNKTTLEYTAKDPAELQHQNIVLKSNADNLALKNYKNGTTPGVDQHLARNEVNLNEMKAKELENTQFPRMAGPMPPEPYEAIYCAEHAGEMGDGYSKRYYSRVYDSPHIGPQGPRYEPLRVDLQAMKKYEANANKDFQANQEYIKSLQNDKMRKSLPNEVSHVDRSKDKTARRVTDHTAVQFKEQQQPLSTYRANFASYVNKLQEPCPVNDFYKDAEYTETVPMKLANSQTPKSLIVHQDSWNKSQANKMHNIKYKSSMPDLRCNITKGKRRIPTAPNCEQFVA